MDHIIMEKMVQEWLPEPIRTSGTFYYESRVIGVYLSADQWCETCGIVHFKSMDAYVLISTKNGYRVGVNPGGNSVTGVVWLNDPVRALDGALTEETMLKFLMLTS